MSLYINRLIIRANMKLNKILILLVGVSCSTLAHTQTKGMYIGTKIGWSHYNASCESQSLDCDKNDLGAGIFLGYSFNNWLSIEGGYDYFGKVHATYPALGGSNKEVDYEAKTQGIELGLKADFDITKSLSLFGKAGALGWQTHKRGEEVDYKVSEKDEGFSPMLGAGLEYALTNNLAARIEYQWFNNVGGNDTGGSNVNFLSIGISYSFGSVTNTGPATIIPVAVEQDVTPKTEPLVITLNSVYMNNILFGFDQTNLNENAFHQLNPMLTRLELYPETRVEIVGYTDSVGSENYNQKLSLKRALSVANFFITKGIDPSRIDVKGYGEINPIASNTTQEGREKNRRVELDSPAIEVEGK